MDLTINRQQYWLLLLFSIFIGLGIAVWAQEAKAFSNFYDSECIECHGPTGQASYASDTCAGCHAHGVHPDSGKDTLNLSATPDNASYSPGATISVSVDGGYRAGWVRVQLWDLNCSVASTCSQDNALVSESLYTSGTTVNFPGPVVLTATAPATPGDYTWYAGWYGNNRDIAGAASGLFIQDTANPGHGAELTAFSFTVAGEPESICDDSIDNNNNGLTDCEDPGCIDAAFGACDTGIPGECALGTLTCDGTAVTPVCEQDQAAGSEGAAGDPTCSDGLDNDCDGLTDANDPDCSAQPEICDNGSDDNEDGLIDCADPLCDNFVGLPGSCSTGEPGICASGTVTCSGSVELCDQDNIPQTEGPGSAPNCTDGLDNDCDGLTDAEDPGCESLGTETICDDFIDNNANGLRDCADPDCLEATFGACDTGLPGACAAGILTCGGPTAAPVCEQEQTAVTEGPAGDPTCTDNIDNDCDGLTDAEEPGCESTGEIIQPGTDVQVTPTADIILTFAEITGEGVVTVVDAVDSTAPVGHRIVGSIVDLDFTGEINGPVAVCLAYDETGVQGSEARLKLFHMDADGQWQDVTTTVDADNNIVCGEITAFSEFSVAEPLAADDDNCFIATAAYGSILEKHVITLREFRDAFLLTNGPGTAFVKAYYRYSPKIADYITGNDALRAMVRTGLAPVVGFSWLAVNYGIIPALLVLFCLLTMFICSTGFISKKRKSG